MRLLLVDDSASHADRIVEALDNAGLEVEGRRVDSAHSLREALSEPWDAVLSGYSMAGLSGAEALRIVRASCDGLPFILMSGAMGEEQAVDMMKLGTDGYVIDEDLTRLGFLLGQSVAKKKAMGEEREALRLAQISIDTAGVLIHWVDQSGRLLYVNDAACRRFGYSKDELLGMTVLDIDPGMSAEIWRRRWQENAERGSVVRETFHRTKGGEVFPVEVTAHHVSRDGGEYCFCFGRDITAYREAEQAVQRAHDMLTKLADRVPGMIYQFRLYPNGRTRFPWTSPAIADVFEVCPEEVHEDADPVYQRLHPEDRERVLRLIKESSRTLRRFQVEYRVVLPQAGERWHFSDAAPERLKDGGTIWHGIISDITERKRAEEEKQGLQVQLLQAQRMETVGRLAGGIAHDFNNLLTAIIGTSSLVLATMAPDDPNRELVVEINEVGERAAQLTRQILAFSRRQVLKPRTLVLNEVVLGIEPLLRRTIGEDVTLGLVLDPDLPVAEIDPHQMEQVLMNLVVNARDAMPEGGRLTIETTTLVPDAAFLKAYPKARSGRYVVLTVTDTGCGMDQDTVPRVFEPFFTTRGVGEGTGLGLSIVLGIVEQSGGFVSADSEPGQGSAFRVHLPAGEASPTGEDDLKSDRKSYDTPGGTETVLVVEDEVMVRELIARILTSGGYSVVEAGSQHEVNEVLSRSALDLDILLTDVVLPGAVSGWEVAESIGARYPGIPVVFMSGYTPEHMMSRGKMGADIEFLEKPFTPGKLMAKMREVLDDAAQKRASADTDCERLE